MPGPRVRSAQGVSLRTAEREDRPFLQRGWTNPEIRRPMGSPVLDREALEDRLDDEGTDRFVVCLDGEEAGSGAPDGEVAGPDAAEGAGVDRIGAATVEDADWKRPEVTYWLVPGARGQGYGRAAVSMVVDYAFRAYDAPAVGAGVFADNEASRGLLESLGFTEEGRQRAYMFVDGEHRDRVQYGIRREAWHEQGRGELE